MKDQLFLRTAYWLNRETHASLCWRHCTGICFWVRPIAVDIDLFISPIALRVARSAARSSVMIGARRRFVVNKSLCPWWFCRLALGPLGPVRALTDWKTPISRQLPTKIRVMVTVSFWSLEVMSQTFFREGIPCTIIVGHVVIALASYSEYL